MGTRLFDKDSSWTHFDTFDVSFDTFGSTRFVVHNQYKYSWAKFHYL